MFLNKKNNNIKEISIEGMMCDNCVHHVTNALESIDGVKKANVSLKKKNAIVILDKDVSNDKLTKVITDLDYKVISIK